MTRKYITVEVQQDVDITLDDVLDGMSDEDKRELIRDIEKDLGADVMPRATVSLSDEIMARHRAEHVGPIWACRDSVCDAWTEEQ